MGIESIWQQICDQIFRVLVLEMDQVTGAIERETVLGEGTAQTAQFRFSFKNSRFVFREMMGGAQSGKPTSNNDNFFIHVVMSTFIRRYAKTPARDKVPARVTTAQPRVTWPIRRARLPSRMPTT